MNDFFLFYSCQSLMSCSHMWLVRTIESYIINNIVPLILIVVIVQYQLNLISITTSFNSNINYITSREELILAIMILISIPTKRVQNENYITLLDRFPSFNVMHYFVAKCTLLTSHEIPVTNLSMCICMYTYKYT